MENREYLKNIEYLLALHSINGLGPIRLKAVLEYFKDPKIAWEANPKELLEIGIPKNVADLLVNTRKNLDPISYALNIQKSGISWITLFDDDYPGLLKEIYDPPMVLYFKGEIPSDEKAIAVVGTRKMTGYGRLATEKLAGGLVGAGIVIISGLARGVDTCAHQTAVGLKGQTIAVLGGGLNKIFPPENIKLAGQIAGGFGAVVSEFPPDHPPLPGNFPSRNRIISGLSLAVLVTEAAEDSGSLITARLALEQGRDVFAVPGPITSELSKGPLSLIKQGARLVTEAKEVLEELGIEKISAKGGPAFGWKIQNDIKLSEIENKILELLRLENKHIDEICREIKISAAEVSACLVKMEIYGLARNLGAGFYTKI